MATVGEMATGIAHELYQPLSAIQIGTDFFRNMVEEGQEISPEELVLVCRQMAGQAARAVHTVNHIRDLGRRSDGISEHVDVNEPIRGIAMLMNGQFKSLGVNVVLDLAKKLPPIIGESNRLEQMFLNLVMNAMDAMEDKIRQLPVGTNTLTIRSFEENAQVVVSVSDTGFGIPEDIKEKIFEPFFTTKQVGEGTGLGLSISYGTVKDYNGTIEVASQVGRGSTFKVTFPVSHY
jgi:histidine kinase